jgi:hypothetical protein
MNMNVTAKGQRGMKISALLKQELKAKAEEIPLQAWVGPEVSRRLRLPHFKTIGTWGW